MKPSPKEPPVEKEKVVNPYAIARPHPTDLMLQRQTSFRGFGQLNQVIMMDDDEINSFHYRYNHLTANNLFTFSLPLLGKLSI